MLADARERLRLAAQSGRFVSDAQLHVTLKFLGETREEDIPALIEAMKEAAKSASPMKLQLGRMGSFGGSAGCVAYCGVAGDTGKLYALNAALENALFARGFARDRKRFTPHFTLGRDVRGFEPLPVEPAWFYRKRYDLVPQRPWRSYAEIYAAAYAAIGQGGQ